jgi:hypothetical protein
MTVLGFDCYAQSTGGTQTVAAYIYPEVGGSPSATALASTTMTIGAAANFYTATFASPVNVTGNFYIGYQTAAQNVFLCNLNSGAGGVAFYRDLVNGPVNWTQSALVDTPSWRVSCQSSSPGFATPVMGTSGLPSLGATFNLTLSDALGTTFALIASGTSNATSGGSPLPAALPGAPGCSLLVSPDVIELQMTDAGGNASHPVAVPNNAALTGLSFYYQWAVWDPTVNSMNIVTSDGGIATVGQ